MEKIFFPHNPSEKGPAVRERGLTGQIFTTILDQTYFFNEKSFTFLSEKGEKAPQYSQALSEKWDLTYELIGESWIPIGIFQDFSNSVQENPVPVIENDYKKIQNALVNLYEKIIQNRQSESAENKILLDSLNQSFLQINEKFSNISTSTQIELSDTVTQQANITLREEMNALSERMRQEMQKSTNFEILLNTSENDFSKSKHDLTQLQTSLTEAQTKFERLSNEFDTLNLNFQQEKQKSANFENSRKMQENAFSALKKDFNDSVQEIKTLIISLTEAEKEIRDLRDFLERFKKEIEKGKNLLKNTGLIRKIRNPNHVKQ